MELEEVLTREGQAWADLTGAIAAVPAERRSVAGVVPDWSTHDVAWHTAYWAGQGADAEELILQGQPEPPDEGATEAENAAIAEASRKMSWDEVMGDFERYRTSARESLAAFDGDVPQRALEFFAD
jgi:hypothetical protein